ncbi:Hemolysins and related proteins containing CBS domains [uncultured Gammaproteobacteria bacterium]|uniref:HlyC/CorC family transporter n=1 Tax=thiotrophic endosymbiont of Bathymodiolus puteoserpentis (Logatchev) TaxID=343240 RepID=UPI00111A578A|nr:CNNM domain-containing protein [thiotrophic endosymbiont of Bathymodiolus puteoserpentis (Logatchev)]CAC9599285.1 Putative membrane protein YfjD [uncultured Gammaproteobacteria bacterium]CAC9654566.1 Putative membrane protein YfjD [uncultured Gammaproteobacteria bacterium]VVH51832.1 Hemolysins and related proteins containing CBS domains [uncultured Gammaproteobacteria bacterium]
MDSLSTPWLIIILLGLILASAFFSSTETSMMAINRYRLKVLAKTNKNAKRTERLLDDLDHLIGTILLGNNLVNIFAASIATILAIKLWGEGSVILASLALTFVILVFAETTPKTFAAKNPEKVALPASIVIDLFIKLFKPFVWIIAQISKIILASLGVKTQNENESITSEELRMVVNDAKPIIASNYQKMLLNIIDLEKVKVEDIMIPRNELISVDINKPGDLLKQLKHIQHTRLLIYDTSSDNITGLLHMRDIVNLYAKGDFSIENVLTLIRTPYFVPEGTSLAHQLAHFQTQKRRLGLVVDEYGEVRGAIVVEDILEEIVGQFTSNQNEIIDEIIKQKDGSYLVDPRVNIRELNLLLQLDLSVTKAKTLNGLILETLQSIPKHDVSLKIDNILIDIVQISEQTIKLVRLTKLD